MINFSLHLAPMQLRILFISLGLTLAYIPLAKAQQTGNIEVRQGNKRYNKGQYPQAEVRYRQALQHNQTNSRALYNLANTLLKENKAKEAYQTYEKALKHEHSAHIKAYTYHNMGVIMQAQQQYAAAIQLYKASLRLNPQDDMTRYNLALAQKLLRNQPPQPQPQNKTQNNKNKNKNKQEQQKQQQQTPQKRNLSKDNTEQLLNLSEQAEKSVQQRVTKQKQENHGRPYLKNW